jgi:hypothetical protein
MTFKYNPPIPGYTPSPNALMHGDGFYVSYNAHDYAVYGSDTTALVFGQMQMFYILNGDHRAPYAELVSRGFDACLDYFKANIDRINHRSDQPTSDHRDLLLDVAMGRSTCLQS